MKKTSYVTSALRNQSEPSGRHHCHWPNCQRAVPPAAWGCRGHWFKLPKEIRDEIWKTFKPGQEISKTPSRAYVEAAKRAQAWIAKHEAEQQEGRLI